MDPMAQTLELVHKAQHGDAQAMNALLQRYHERLRRSIRASLHPRMRSLLDTVDIVQQTMTKAVTLIDGFEMRTEGAFLHWLRTIALRQISDARDHVEAKKRRPEGQMLALDHQDGDGPSLHERVAGQETGPDGRAMRMERQQAVEDCLHQLPEEHRQSILLRDYDGMEWMEVAKTLGKNTDSAARELHRRAMLLLAKCLTNKGVDAP